MPTPEDWIALTLLPGLGPRLQHQALERFGDPGEIAFRVSPDAFLGLPRCPGSVPERVREARRTLARDAEREVIRCRDSDVRLLLWPDGDYPAAWRELTDPPLVVYLRGELPPGAVRIAMVGSRSPTPYGQRLATGLAGGLADRGFEVVSGGARGIDALAHRACLEFGGRTVAILGSGLRRPYPDEHRKLFRAVAGSGAVLSELPLEEPPRPEHFPRRNRLISGLAAGVVVVEAAEKSGTLITAGHALDQGREVLAIPGPVTSSRSAGCHRLIQQGAKLVQNIEDILEELSPMYRESVPHSGADEGTTASAPELENVTADERSLLELLDEVEPRHLDELAGDALFGIARFHTALFGLRLRGAVEQLPGGYYLLRPSRKA